MFAAFLLNLTVPLRLKWWKPYYLGFKELKLFGINLARPELAPVPDDLPEDKDNDSRGEKPLYAEVVCCSAEEIKICKNPAFS